VNALTVTASNARPTDTGASSRRGPGVDVDVTITAGPTVRGSVTLLPHEDGRHGYGRWGERSHWIDGRLLSDLEKLGHDVGGVLDAIEESAARAAAEIGGAK
jgi:hypothetical protein